MKRRLLILACISAAVTFAVLLILHSLEHNIVSKADSITRGMSTNQVLQVMGNPRRVSARSSSSYFEEWHYDVPGKWHFSVSLRPFRISTWQRDWITVNFEPDGSVSSVWIPSSTR